MAWGWGYDFSRLISTLHMVGTSQFATHLYHICAKRFNFLRVESQTLAIKKSQPMWVLGIIIIQFNHGLATLFLPILTCAGVWVTQMPSFPKLAIFVPQPPLMMTLASTQLLPTVIHKSDMVYICGNSRDDSLNLDELCPVSAYLQCCTSSCFSGRLHIEHWSSTEKHWLD